MAKASAYIWTKQSGIDALCFLPRIESSWKVLPTINRLTKTFSITIGEVSLHGFCVLLRET